MSVQRIVADQLERSQTVGAISFNRPDSRSKRRMRVEEEDSVYSGNGGRDDDTKRLDLPSAKELAWIPESMFTIQNLV